MRHTELQHWDPSKRWYRPLVCFVVVQTSRFVMRALNRLEFVGREHWETAFAAPGQGVLTFSNHVSLFDDPLVTSGLGRTGYDETRWIPADHLNFFGTRLKGTVFSSGKCVPIIRGAGLEQPGLAFLVERLREGAWVHIFPEGGRTREPDARLRRPFKMGIGRLITEAKPLLLPFYHRGMEAVLPIGGRLPRLGKTVRVLFDPPTQVNDAWLETLASEGSDEEGLRHRVTQWCEATLAGLERRALEHDAVSVARTPRALTRTRPVDPRTPRNHPS
ncbi:MAG: lysophospholipid acyltransferase family protein [Myxococcota bacterium]